MNLASGAWEQPPKVSKDGCLAYDAQGVRLLAGLDGMLYGWGGEAMDAGSHGISALLWRDSSAGGIHVGDFPEGKVLEYGLWPFIPGDLVKLYLASLLLPVAWSVARRG